MNLRSHQSILLILLVSASLFSSAATFPNMQDCSANLEKALFQIFQAIQNRLDIPDDLRAVGDVVKAAGVCTLALPHAQLPPQCKDAVGKTLRDSTFAIGKFGAKPTKAEAIKLLEGIKADIQATLKACTGH